MSARRKTPRKKPLAPSDLAEWRNRNHLSLAAIAEQTKIGLRYLEAIECGKFQRLPGGTYNISYLRQYAQAIHFDEDLLVEYYRGVSNTVPPPEDGRPETAIGRVRGWIRSLVTPAS